MAKTVFILGAGASAHAGAPVMNNFLQVARELRETGKGTPEFDTVFRGVSMLGRTHSKWPLYTARDKNMETAFAAFEMAEMIWQFPGHKPEDVAQLVPAMRKVINTTLDQKTTFPMIEGRINPTNAYYRFAVLIRDLHKSRKASDVKPRHTVAVITFNYDIAAEIAFLATDTYFNYTLQAEPSGDMPFLKLHGSLNWAQCEKCGEIVPWEFHIF